MEKEKVMEYMLLLVHRKATLEQEEELASWLDESEENRCIYLKMLRMYYQLNEADCWQKIDTGKAVKKMRKAISHGTVRSLWQNRRAGLVGIAALLAVSIGAVVFLQTKEKVDSLPLAVNAEVKAGEMKAMLTLANGQKVELSNKEQNIDLGFVCAVEDSAAGLKYQLKDSVVIPREMHTLSVPRAGEYMMTLSDGSRVWLNSESVLKFPVTFDAGKREIYLSGEAYFEVAKDARRPFVVITPQTRTTVLGTSFNVTAYQGEQRTEITLVSGAVSVAAGAQERRITPGHQVAVDHDSGELTDREVKVSLFTSWRDGVFDFDDMTLSELCVKLSRWYDVDFFFVHQAAAEKRFTGAIKRNRHLQFMLDFIQKTSGVHFEIKGKTVTVYNN